jgi:hypothetical protein
MKVRLEILTPNLDALDVKNLLSFVFRVLRFCSLSLFALSDYIAAVTSKLIPSISIQL